MSLRFHYTMLFTKLQVDRFEFLLNNDFLGIAIKDDTRALYFQVNTITKVCCTWRVNRQKTLMSRRKDYSSVDRYSEGKNYRIEVRPRGYRIETKIAMAEELTRHFLGFLKVKEFGFESDMRPVSNDVENCFAFRFSKVFDNLEFNRQCYKKNPVAPEGLKFILESLKSNKLTVNLHVTDPSFQYLNPLNTRYLKIVDPNWTNFPGLGDEVERLELKNPFNEFPVKAVNQLMKDWVKGHYTKIADVIIWTRKVEEDLHEQLFSEINTVQTEFTDRDLRYRFLPPQSQRLRDIVRVTDNRHATVSFAYDRVSIYVWQDKHLIALLGNFL
ncbi:unnamed protein product [Caenorhabditis brenneri]